MLIRVKVLSFFSFRIRVPRFIIRVKPSPKKYPFSASFLNKTCRKPITERCFRRKHYRKFLSLSGICQNVSMKEERSEKRAGGQRQPSPQNLRDRDGHCVRLPLLAVKPSRAKSYTGMPPIPRSELRAPRSEKLPNEPILEFSICLQTQGILNIMSQTEKKTNPFWPALCSDPSLSSRAWSCLVVPHTYQPVTFQKHATRNTQHAYLKLLMKINRPKPSFSELTLARNAP